ncbi:hypothetical protein LINGRAHAP2_LOCUS17180 [Linum grandiflorum]
METIKEWRAMCQPVGLCTALSSPRVNRYLKRYPPLPLLLRCNVDAGFKPSEYRWDTCGMILRDRGGSFVTCGAFHSTNIPEVRTGRRGPSIA